DERRIQRDRRFCESLKLNHALLGKIYSSRYLFWKRVASEFLIELARNALHLINQFHYMYGDMNGTRMLSHGTADGLSYPPCGIRAEAKATARIELLRSTNQPQVALLNQIKQRDAMVAIAFGNTHYQSEVSFHQALLCFQAPGSNAIG